MTKEYTYKLQGNGKDSWVVTEKDTNGVVINKYMVYENPNEDKDVKSLIKAFKGLDADQKTQLKTILNQILK